MAFSTSLQLTSNRIAALNELRTGMMVQLPQVNKHRDPIFAQVQRPIILSTEKVQTLHEGQLEIEVNEVAVMDRSQLLTSLWNAAARLLSKIEEPQPRIIELESAAPYLGLDPPDDPAPQGSSP